MCLKPHSYVAIPPPLLNAEDEICRAEAHIVLKPLKEHAERDEAKRPSSAEAEKGSEA